MQDGNNVLINIERTAANGGELPDDLELPEQLLFLTLRELYSNYKAGAVERERAKREKQRILSAYRALKISYEITNEHEKIRKRLEQNMVELHNCDCPHCRKLLRIFHGVERKDIPEDIKTLHEHNEKLRELVKERSERAGYLATVIDKIKWALEDNNVERAKEIINEYRNN